MLGMLSHNFPDCSTSCLCAALEKVTLLTVIVTCVTATCVTVIVATVDCVIDQCSGAAVPCSLTALLLLAKMMLYVMLLLL
jgi:zinc transporter ZupT